MAALAYLPVLVTVVEACLKHPENATVKMSYVNEDGEPDDDLGVQVVAADKSHALVIDGQLRFSKAVAATTERRLHQAGRLDAFVMPGLSDPEKDGKKVKWEDPKEGEGKYVQAHAEPTTEAERRATILKSVAILNCMAKKSVVIFLLTVADDLVEMIKAGLNPDVIKAIYAQGGELSSGIMGFNWIKGKESIQFLLKWIQEHQIPMYLLSQRVYGDLKLAGVTAFPGGSLTEMDHPEIFDAFRRSPNKALGEILYHAAGWGRFVGKDMPVVRKRSGEAYLKKLGKELTPEAIDEAGKFVLEHGICMADVLVAMLAYLESFLAERVSYTFDGDKTAWTPDPTSMVYAVRDLDVKAVLEFLHAMALRSVA